MSWFGFRGDKSDKPKQIIPGDRHGAHFGLNESQADSVVAALSSHSGAEQDRYRNYFSLTEEQAAKLKTILTSGAGAEQERHAAHFSLPPELQERLDVARRQLDHSFGSGAEVDRWSSHFSMSEQRTARIKEILTSGPGAEQDRYSSRFGLPQQARDKIDEARSKWRPESGGMGAEQDRYGSKFGVAKERVDHVKDAARSNFNRSAGSEQDRFGLHFGFNPDNPVRTGTTIGLLRTAVLPSFGLHSGLAIAAYGIGRYTNHVDAKDHLWPSAPVINAWWSAIGSRMYKQGIPFSTAWSSLSYPEKALLGGVSVWGLRLFYRIFSRSIERGVDEPRYEEEKNEEGAWNKFLFTKYLPEAAALTVISLPFTLPFRDRASVIGAALSPPAAFAETAHALAIFLFGSGIALETLADTQLATHRKDSSELYRAGVFSIVRHPNYLGDALVHSSFSILLYSCGLLHPVALLAPVTNYLFLRYVGGDKETEEYQEKRYKSDAVKGRQFKEYRQTKNSFWPKVQEFPNPWFLTVAGVGAVAVIVERGVREYILH